MSTRALSTVEKEKNSTRNCWLTHHSEQVCAQHLLGAVVAAGLPPPRALHRLAVQAVCDGAQRDGVLDHFIIVRVLERQRVEVQGSGGGLALLQ